MTDEETTRLAEITERERAASPTPWHYDETEDNLWVDDAVDRIVAQVRCVEDASFIAHVRSDTLFLLQLADRLLDDLRHARHSANEAYWFDIVEHGGTQGAAEARKELRATQEALDALNCSDNWRIGEPVP